MVYFFLNNVYRGAENRNHIEAIAKKACPRFSTNLYSVDTNIWKRDRVESAHS